MPNIDFRFLYEELDFFLISSFDFGVKRDLDGFWSGFMWLALWISACECIMIKHTPIQQSICDETAIVVVTQDIHIHTHTHTEWVCGQICPGACCYNNGEFLSASSICKCELSFTGKSPQEHRDIPEWKCSSLKDRSVFDHSKGTSKHVQTRDAGEQENLQWKQSNKHFTHQE